MRRFTCKWLRSRIPLIFAYACITRVPSIDSQHLDEAMGVELLVSETRHVHLSRTRRSVFVAKPNQISGPSHVRRQTDFLQEKKSLTNDTADMPIQLKVTPCVPTYTRVRTCLKSGHFCSSKFGPHTCTTLCPQVPTLSPRKNNFTSPATAKLRCS